MKTLKQILRTLSDLEKYETRLDGVVLDSIEHCIGNTYSPDALNAVHAFLIANSHTTLAKRYREYVNGTSPMFWNEKESKFQLSKKQRNSKEFHVVWAANLGKYWRIQLDKDQETKKAPATLAQRVERAKKQAEKENTPSAKDRIEAAKVLLANMAADEIVLALGDKAEFVLNILAAELQAKAA